ncbi:hypothetical protein Sd1012_3943 [Shigella dysenteriae 1012]|nr:hypothetical protein Sd1012_3943 [Shigella dysenteriae 1012]
MCASIQSHCVGSKYRVVGSVLVQNTVLLVQCWFNKKNKILIKQYHLQIEPTEPTEPTPFLRT